jgi:hypothetical protein
MKLLLKSSNYRRLSSTLLAILVLGSITTSPVLAAAQTKAQLAPCTKKVAGQNTPKTITKTEVIGYKSVEQNDTNLAQGTSNVIQVGHTGKRLITYTATYKKSKLSGCKHTGTAVTQQPLNTITSIGTYVARKPVVEPAPITVAPTPAPEPTPNCTNGTYVNSVGTTVCSPEASSSTPQGATAQCRDGSYSFSQSRSGTCSHHGGVDSWL